MGLTYSSVISAEPEEVFGWHTRRGAITRLLPPWQPVRVVQEAPSVRDGQVVLALPGGLGWVASHDPDGYEWPRQFADALEPPLSAALHWRHVHRFEPADGGGTLVTDEVDTPVPARMLRPMFGYRHRQLAADLAAHAQARAVCPEPLTIAVTGSGGLVGSALTALLSTGGHEVIRLVRRPPRRPHERQWRPDDPDPGLLGDVDAVIHLAGASIGGRFTPAHKQEIHDSRIGPTRKLATLAAASAPGLRAFVTASAVGLYGADRGDEILTEDSERGEGFLADVAAAWEEAAAPAAAAGIRSVQVRTGIVQTPRGGVLRLMYPLFATGLGGPLGDGSQWLAWIEIDDLLDIYLRAVTDPELSGPVNAVAPEPVQNAEYAWTLGRVLRRPAALPVPAAGPRLLLGAEGARELAAASQRVRPAALAAAGHHFRYPDLEGALRHLLGREPTTADSWAAAVKARRLPKAPGDRGMAQDAVADRPGPSGSSTGRLRLLEVRWEHRADPPRVGPGDTFTARNCLNRTTWTSRSVITAAHPGRSFSFAVSGTEKPTATWEFALQPRGGGATVTYTVTLGDGPSMFGHFTGSDPARRAAAEQARLDQLAVGHETAPGHLAITCATLMTATVPGERLELWMPAPYAQVLTGLYAPVRVCLAGVGPTTACSPTAGPPACSAA